MKKVKIISLLLAVTLSLPMAGCGKKIKDGDDVSGTDESVFAVGVVEPGDVMPKNMVEIGPLDYNLSVYPGEEICTTGSVVYAYGNEMIYFLDKSVGFSMPLCGKPECQHIDETCGAYIGRNCEALSVYDGKLYWVANFRDISVPTSVMCCDLDGTNRKTVVQFDPRSKENKLLVDDIRAGYKLFIHRGYLYVAGPVLDSGGIKSKVRVLSVSLADGKVTKLFESGAGWRFSAKPVGDEMYIMISDTSGRDIENFIWGTEHLEAHRIDLNTGKAEELFSFDSDAENISYECWDSFPVPGDGIYFERVYEYEKTEGTGIYATIASVLKYSFTSGQIEEVSPKLEADGCDWFFGVYFLNNCMVTRSMGVSYLFNFEGKYLTKIKYDPVGVTPVLADDEYLYYYEVDLDEGFHMTGKEYYVCVPMDGGDAIRFE